MEEVGFCINAFVCVSFLHLPLVPPVVDQGLALSFKRFEINPDLQAIREVAALPNHEPRRNLSAEEELDRELDRTLTNVRLRTRNLLLERGELAS